MRKPAPAALTLVSLVWLLVASPAATQEPVTVPSGTVVYGMLAQGLSPYPRDLTQGQSIPARVWRPVVVDGYQVVEEGARMTLRVTAVGREQLRLQAIEVEAVDGSELPLSGGYDRSAAAGREVIEQAARRLETIRPAGMLFDARVREDARVSVSEEQRAPEEPDPPPLEVDILFGRIPVGSRVKSLPVKLSRCGGGVTVVRVVAVDGVGIEPIPVLMDFVARQGDCLTGEGSIDLKELSRHFQRGINRMTVDVGGVQDEVLIPVEL